jgi:SAM-dependent methyltransferase/uncharacterized protein YbaR (Trm112 family)
MNIDLLAELACPSTLTGQRCQGALKITAAPPARFDARDSNEFVEGALECVQCGAYYPVLCGVAVLVPDPGGYLQNQYKTVIGLAFEHNLDISPAMRGYLHKIGAHLESGSQKAAEDSPRALSSYLRAHYDQSASLFESLPPEHPLAAFGMYYQTNNVYSVLLSLIPHLPADAKILDLGCHVGRLTRDLASQGRQVLGVDISFAAVFLARRAIRAWPTRLTEYETTGDRLKREKRPLNLPGLSKGEAIVASATQLPLKAAAYQAVVSANLIDILPDPIALLHEIRFMLAENGFLALSTPYHSGASRAALRWLGANSKMGVDQALRWRISHHFKIIETRENIPWVLGEHARRYQIYINDCILAQKQQKK